MGLNKRDRDQRNWASVYAKITGALWAVRDSMPTILQARAAGLGLQATADKLNAAGLWAAEGGLWGPEQVRRTLERHDWMRRRDTAHPRKGPITCNRCSAVTGLTRELDPDPMTLIERTIVNLCAECASGDLECPECGEVLSYIGRAKGRDSWVCPECSTVIEAAGIGTPKLSGLEV